LNAPESFPVFIYFVGTLRLNGSSFKNNSWGSIIHLRKEYVWKRLILIENCTFARNAAPRGSVIRVDSKVEHDLWIVNSVFIDNDAEQGGALFLRTSSIATLGRVRQCVFQNNTALGYGHSIASTAVKLDWIKPLTPLSLTSGDTLPPFTFAMFDAFGNAMTPLLIDVDFLYVELKLVCQNASVCGEVGDEIEKGMNVYENTISFTRTTVASYPGTYFLLIQPKINFNPGEFNLSTLVTIRDCQLPFVWQYTPFKRYPRCVIRKCKTTILCIKWMTCLAATCRRGCPPSFGLCIGNDVCVCSNMREGLSCERTTS
jgi:hypothetical protein